MLRGCFVCVSLLAIGCLSGSDCDIERNCEGEACMQQLLCLRRPERSSTTRPRSPHQTKVKEVRALPSFKPCRSTDKSHRVSIYTKAADLTSQPEPSGVDRRPAQGTAAQGHGKDLS